METRANYIAIGLFAIAVLVAGFVFVLWLERFGENSSSRDINLVIPGSASGLARGSPVLFNGLRVGSVTLVEFDKTNPGNVKANLQINSDVPLRADTKVSIASQPLTGLASVSLLGGTVDAQPLLQLDDTPELRATTSSLQGTIDEAAATVKAANLVLTRVNNLLDSNIGSINNTVNNVEAFTNALASNADNIDSLLQNVADASQSIGELSKTVSAVSGDIEAVVKAVEPETVKTTLENVEVITTNFAKSSERIDEIAVDAKATLKNFAKLSEDVNGTLSKVDGLVSAVDPARISSVVASADTLLSSIDPASVSTTLGNVEKITTDFANTTDDFDRIVGNVDRVVTDLSLFSSGLNTTVTSVNALVARVDGDQLERTLENVETFTGSLNSTLKEVDTLVGALDAERVNALISNLESFAGKLNSTGDEIDAILASAKDATDDVAVFTESLSGNKENIDKIVADATVISDRLKTTTLSLNSILGRVDGLVDADGRSFIVEATDAAKAIRQISESFQARADTISQGLERFSTRGLGDIEALISQSRQAVARIEGLVRGLESNPTQFLLGGGKKVPEYRRQRR
ncbi:MAG: MlaD family protein [Pseudomonadota bacterium]